MGKDYTDYKNSLNVLGLQTLEERRKFLCLTFSKKCLRNDKVKDLFKLNKTKHQMKKRKTYKYEMVRAKTKRYKQSSLPYMTKLLNEENELKRKIMKNI